MLPCSNENLISTSSNVPTFKKRDKHTHFELHLNRTRCAFNTLQVSIVGRERTMYPDRGDSTIEISSSITEIQQI